MKVAVVRNVLEANDRIAAENRAIFLENGVFVLNMMSSPGAGKTSLLERTIDALHDKMRIGVIEGDIQTDIDARRISKWGIPTVQINTNDACHLDGNMIRAALDSFDLKALDLLIIENVGNLVCPAEFDTGENEKVALLSIPEGHDKPSKYPLMFHEAGVLIINKIDLLPYIDCSLDTMKTAALKINPGLEVFEVSCKTQEGLAQWYGWLQNKVSRVSD